MILGIRPEDLEDAELEPDSPGDQTLDGEVELTEALGSEVMVHFSIDATPAITDEVRELQKDAGTEGMGTPAQEEGGRTIMVGRFGARSKADQGRAGPRRRRHARIALLRPGDGSRHLRRNRKRGSKRMTKRRFILLALLVGVLAFLAAGCGGDDDEAGGTGGATTEEGGGEAVSGNISVLAVWTGAEGEAFQAVLDGFKEENPDVTVSYKSASEPATVLSTAVEGGNPPDIAALPQPGFMTDFAERGALKPIEFARDGIEEGYSESWLDLGTVEDELYGLFFKGANKSTVWYNVAAFEDAGVEPPADWDAFIEAGDTLKASGVTPYSIGAADGWTLTDLFENIYLRTAGGDKYDQLTKHEIPWTDESVKEALTEMGKVVASDNIAGGTSSALQTDFPTSVTQVFADPPKAAQVLEGDFVGGVIAAETQAEPEDRASTSTPSRRSATPARSWSAAAT